MSYSYDNIDDEDIKAWDDYREEAKQNDKIEAIKYIKNIISNSYFIFEKSLSIDEISKNIYDTLRLENYTDIDILNNRCNEKIIMYITNNDIGIKFNPEFNYVYNYVREKTTHVFNTKKKNMIDNEQKPYAYYDSLYERNKIAFSIAFNVYLEKLNVEELYKSGKLYSMITENVNKDIMKKNSTSKNILARAKVDNSKYHTLPAINVKKLIAAVLVILGILTLSYHKDEPDKKTYNVPNEKEIESVIDEDDEIITSMSDKIDNRLIEKIIERQKEIEEKRQENISEYTRGER